MPVLTCGKSSHSGQMTVAIDSNFGGKSKLSPSKEQYMRIGNSVKRSTSSQSSFLYTIHLQSHTHIESAFVSYVLESTLNTIGS